MRKLLQTLRILVRNSNVLYIGDQRLIFSGKQLEDSKRFADYDVPNGATFHIVLRLVGGGNEPFKAYGIVLFDWDGNISVQVHLSRCLLSYNSTGF